MGSRIGRPMALPMTAGSTARIAVVTGAFDEIENVLGKLGFGTVYPEGAAEGMSGFGGR